MIIARVRMGLLISSIFGGLLTIVSLVTAQLSSSAQKFADLDLVWQQSDQDPNGFPENPQWYWQLTHANTQQPNPNVSKLCDSFPYKNGVNPTGGVTYGNPPCVSQPTRLDFPYGFNDFICTNFGGKSGRLHGHVEWRPTRYDGRIAWKGFKPWYKLGDGDYNFWLFPRNSGGLTVANNEALSLEFDSHETINHFNTPWWNLLHKAVDEGNPQPLVNGRYAIVIGMLGIDSEHEDHSEIHPVYVMAIHVKQDRSDDVWAIFARNWGNQGYCSQEQHFLKTADNQLSVVLPPPPGLSGAQLGNGTIFDRSAAGVSWGMAPVANGALFTVTFAKPEGKTRINGELHLQWTRQNTNQLPFVLGAEQFSTFVSAGISAPENVSTESETENGLTREYAGLTPQSQKDIEERLKQLDKVVAPDSEKSIMQEAVLPRDPFDSGSFLIKPAPTPASVTTEVDEQKRQRDFAQAKAICEEKGKDERFFPGIPMDVCHKFVAGQH